MEGGVTAPFIVQKLRQVSAGVSFLQEAPLG